MDAFPALILPLIVPCLAQADSDKMRGATESYVLKMNIVYIIYQLKTFSSTVSYQIRYKCPTFY